MPPIVPPNHMHPTDVVLVMSTFDRLFAEAEPLVRAQRHQRDAPPRDGGRWPISVVLRPPQDCALAHALDALTREAAAIAGPDHWQTGQLGSAHLTVRALEPRRDVIPSDDPAIARYQSALHRAAFTTDWPARFQITGLTLTPGSVMACAESLDANAGLFSKRLTTELGTDAYYEPNPRDIWYLNLLHFTSDIAKPDELIDWVAQRRGTTVGTTTITGPELVRSDYRPGLRPHMRSVDVRAL
jgi:hypothetical protein